MSINNFHGWLMPPLHIKKMFAILLLLLITFTSLSYSDYQICKPTCHFQFIVNFIRKNNAVIITFFKFSTMRKSTVFVFILLQSAYAEDSVESCPKITSTEVSIQDGKYFQSKRLSNKWQVYLVKDLWIDGRCSLIWEIRLGD